jgi:hypothetical protein
MLGSLNVTKWRRNQKWQIREIKGWKVKLQRSELMDPVELSCDAEGRQEHYLEMVMRSMIRKWSEFYMLKKSELMNLLELMNVMQEEKGHEHY